MLDPIDYKEPSCPLTDGKQFYYPSPDDTKGTVPARRIVERLDSFFEKNDTRGAEEFLLRWEREAKELGDRRGEITIQNELMGLYRKAGKQSEAYAAAERAAELVSAEGIDETVPAATVYLNAATVKKAFGDPVGALELYEKTSKIYRENLPDDDEKIAGLYNNSALALCDLGRYDEAEELFVLAAAIMSEKEDGALDEAATYVNMAHMYKCRDGEGTSAVAECLDSAWEILDSPKTPINSYYAFVASKCAPSFREFSRENEAKILEERSRAIYEGA